MINKYQQGGEAPQLGGGILAQIQQLPQDQYNQIMQAFDAWLQEKGVDPNQVHGNPQVEEQALGQFMQEVQAKQTQIARQGAKLKFIKNLKHQCAEDEELKYFKVGGTIGCNCVKKDQKGGKTEPKKNAIQQFKNRTKAQQDSINKKSEEDYFSGTAYHEQGKDQGKKKIILSKNAKKDKCGGKMKKHQIGGTIETLRLSLGLEKKND